MIVINRREENNLCAEIFCIKLLLGWALGKSGRYFQSCFNQGCENEVLLRPEDRAERGKMVQCLGHEPGMWETYVPALPQPSRGTLVKSLYSNLYNGPSLKRVS